MFLLSRDQARAYYGGEDNAGAAIGGAAPLRPLDPQDELYRLLGLVPAREERSDGQPSQDRDLRQQSVDNLVAQITGFYSPDLEAFYMLETIIGGVSGGSARATMAHEFTHALQDQYHDLNALAAARADDWDAFRALQDVVEGDAIASESAYLGFTLRSTYRLPVCFRIPAPARAGVPFGVERELDTWYEDGPCFIEAVTPLLANGVADVWAALPTTTEQILHPEKYLAGEGALPVSLPPLTPALGAGWRSLLGSSFGEFSLQNLLLLGLAADRVLVQRAAAGWGGDAWELYTRGDDRLLAYAVEWDDAGEAREFWAAFVASLSARSPVARPAPDALMVEIGGVVWRAALVGARVDLVVSTDAAAAMDAAAAIGLP